MKSIPVVLGFDKDKVVGELILNKRIPKRFLFNSHIAFGIIAKTFEDRFDGERIVETLKDGEIDMASIQSDSTFTDLEGQKYYSQRQVDKLLKENKKQLL